MMLPVKKYYEAEQHQLESNTYEVFSKDFFNSQLLVFLSRVGDVYKGISIKANKKEMMHLYVLGFKAVLGVGIALGAKEDISQPNLKTKSKNKEELLLDVYEKAVDLKYTLKDHTFYSMFSSYLLLGESLGFNFDDISYVYENEMEG